VRAQLAFEGFDSKITTNNGWNRVVIGPVKGKENAVRAQLAFEGFDSKITTNNGWNRVVIGPVKGKE
ncbi:SPOR domain-containing protein, partial [Salmonella enterica subsp. enterica serovar Typhi]|nr:SPOR domain-containing protein [Salmonella enterica subsp. enterica serovar Typhi]